MDEDIVRHFMKMKSGVANHITEWAVSRESASPNTFQILKTQNARIAVFRQTHPELLRPGGLIDESHHIYTYLNGQWGSQKKKWTFPSGATISFSAIANIRDIES